MQFDFEIMMSNEVFLQIFGPGKAGKVFNIRWLRFSLSLSPFIFYFKGKDHFRYPWD